MNKGTKCEGEQIFTLFPEYPTKATYIDTAHSDSANLGSPAKIKHSQRNHSGSLVTIRSSATDIASGVLSSSNHQHVNSVVGHFRSIVLCDECTESAKSCSTYLLLEYLLVPVRVCLPN